MLDSGQNRVNAQAGNSARVFSFDWRRVRKLERRSKS
jgi:hypothetical protein